MHMQRINVSMFGINIKVKVYLNISMFGINIKNKVYLSTNSYFKIK